MIIANFPSFYYHYTPLQAMVYCPITNETYCAKLVKIVDREKECRLLVYSSSTIEEKKEKPAYSFVFSTKIQAG